MTTTNENDYDELAGIQTLKKAWEEGFEHNAQEQLAALHERIEMPKG